MKGSASLERSISVYFVGGTSNKEYHLYMCRHSDGTYSVHSEYGSRGNPNRTDDKTKSGRVSRFSANEIFNEVEDEKRSKGYKNLPVLRSPTKVPSGATVAAAPTPTPAPAADLRHTQLSAALALFMKAQPDVESAGDDALKELSKRVGLSKVRALSADVKNMLKAILGDMACMSQDYVDDALSVANKSLCLGANPDQLMRHLSPAAAAAIESARAATAPTNSSAQFLVAALAPLTRHSLF
jgi:hypothetical protein